MPLWSGKGKVAVKPPDAAFLYFLQGGLPGRRSKDGAALRSQVAVCYEQRVSGAGCVVREP
jgi:hypothetical protein